MFQTADMWLAPEPKHQWSLRFSRRELLFGLRRSWRWVVWRLFRSKTYDFHYIQATPNDWSNQRWFGAPAVNVCKQIICSKTNWNKKVYPLAKKLLWKLCELLPIGRIKLNFLANACVVAGFLWSAHMFFTAVLAFTPSRVRSGRQSGLVVLRCWCIVFTSRMSWKMCWKWKCGSSYHTEKHVS